jgi:hypothetical protein
LLESQSIPFSARAAYSVILGPLGGIDKRCPAVPFRTSARGSDDIVLGKMADS